MQQQLQLKATPLLDVPGHSESEGSADGAAAPDSRAGAPGRAAGARAQALKGRHLHCHTGGLLETIAQAGNLLEVDEAAPVANKIALTGHPAAGREVAAADTSVEGPATGAIGVSVHVEHASQLQTPRKQQPAHAGSHAASRKHHLLHTTAYPAASAAVQLLEMPVVLVRSTLRVLFVAYLFSCFAMCSFFLLTALLL